MFKKDQKGVVKGGDDGASNSINLIGAGTSINGEVKTENDIRIDGTVEGNVTTSSKIVLGEQATVKGNIYCGSGDLSGKIEGDIYTKDLLHLNASSKIYGNIYTKRLIVERDAIFNGQCEMKEKVTFDNPVASKGAEAAQPASDKKDSLNQGDEQGKAEQTKKKHSS